MRVFLVPGTWGGEWCKPGSDFRLFIAQRGFEPEWFQGWSESVDGLPRIANVLEGRKHANWIAGGYGLRYKLEDLPLEDRNVILHSHGGQVGLYCAGLAGLKLNRVVTVSTPVRGDMEPTAIAAHANIVRHRHIAAKGWDFWMRAGELLDGHLGWSRKMPHADENLFIDGISHSLLLNDPAQFHHLVETIDGLEPTLDFLQQPPEEPAFV